MEKVSIPQESLSGELDGLQQRHQDLEKRLAVLDRHISLTSAEQAERIRLKKEKLWVKDRIVLLGKSSRLSPH